MGLGRPLKGKARRVQVTFYTDATLLDIVEEYVRNRQAAGERSYSRSDYFNEAIIDRMKKDGLLKDEQE